MFRSILAALFFFISVAAVAGDELRTVSVSGVGAATVTPDKAIVTMSIVEHRKNLAAAQAAVAKVTAKVLTLTDRLQIKREHVDTTGASVRPEYRWIQERNEQELRGYIAERRIQVDVRDLEVLGKLIEGAVATGVNQVSPPQMDSSKRRDAYREALAKAADDAVANAERLASTLGAKLGPVLQVSAGAPSPQPLIARNRYAMQAMAEGDATESYNAADLSFNTNISVVFALQDD